MTCIGLALLILGASPYLVWQRVYDGGKVDMGHGLCLDSSGHVVVVGETNQASNYDSWIITISKSGDSLWSWFYDDGDDEKGMAITTTREGSIAVFTSIDTRVKTMLFDSNGSIIWQHERIAPNTIGIAGIIATVDDRIYTADWYRSSNLEYLNMDCYSCEGELIFYTNTATAWSRVTDITAGSLGHIYLGSSKGGPCALWRYSLEGELEWFREYGNSTTSGYALERNDADHFFLSGDFLSTNYDFLLLKWDAVGMLIWPEHKAYDLGADERCRDLKLDSISDCYLAGWQDRGDEDIALVKTDSAGEMLWTWVDTVEGKQEIEGIEIDEDGYIYLAGSHYNGENWDMLVMKVAQPLTISGRVTDSTGKAMKDIAVALTGDTTVEVQTDAEGYYTIEVYNGGNYTVSPNLPGWAFEPSSRTYSPLAHREWDQDFENGRWTGIAEEPRVSSVTLEVSSSGIHFILPLDQEGTITIYNPSGQLIERMGIRGSGTAGFRAGLPAGVYLVRLETDNLKITKKAVLLH